MPDTRAPSALGKRQHPTPDGFNVRGNLTIRCCLYTVHTYGRKNNVQVAARRCSGSSMVIDGSTHHIPASKLGKRRKGSLSSAVADRSSAEGDAAIVEDAGLKYADGCTTPAARLSGAPAVGSGMTSGSDESVSVSQLL